MIPILKECLTYEPDLLILCCGHNEFLEERSYPQLGSLPPIVRHTVATLQRLRLCRALESAWYHVRPAPGPNSPPQRPVLSSEVDALLDYRDGMEAYHRDPAWEASVLRHFRHNVDRMIASAREADVPMILMLPPSNLKDCPPFKSEHRAELSQTERQRWAALDGARADRPNRDPQETAQALREALAIDEQFALTHYRLGKVYEAAGDGRLARKHFLQARELDVCPLRMRAVMEAELKKLATTRRVPLLDVNVLLARECQFGIVGNEILLDHVHPSIRGHRIIADGLLPMILDRVELQLPEGWENLRDDAFRRHIAALDPMYFTRGLRRLKAVQAWAEGRADGQPLEARAGSTTNLTESPPAH
jgi:lysophospholipase L1-like esterase